MLKEPAFCKHQSGDSHDLASSVVHFTNSAIVENPKYKEWINRFPKDTKHLFINENNKCLGSVGVQRLQHKLNILHEEIFPLLPNSGIPEFPRNLTSSVPLNHSVVHVEKEHEDNFDNLCLPIFNEVENIYKDKVYFSCEDKPFIEGETLCELYIKPKYKYDYSRSLILKKQHFLNEVFSIEGFQEELNKLKCELQSMKLTNEYYPRILFLGTGSSQPNKLRNTSGILVFLDEKNYILLDCGESTYNQFVQFFGKERVKELLRNLNVIYVSHLHADHHIGLITILKQRKLAFDEKCELDRKNNLKPAEFQPVHLLAPIQLSRWLNLFDQEFESITHLFNILPNASLVSLLFQGSQF